MLQIQIISFFFTKSITDDYFSQIIIPSGAYEIKNLDIEIKRLIIEEGYFTEATYPFQNKPNFSTLRSIIEISTRELIISFFPDDSIRDRLRFNSSTLYEQCIPSPSPVDILSFDNFFIENDIARGMTFEGIDRE